MHPDPQSENTLSAYGAPLAEMPGPDFSGDIAAAWRPEGVGSDASIKELWRFANGMETAAELRGLRRTMQAFFEHQGSIPLNRMLRIPASHTAFQKATRNEHLCKAAELIHVPPGASGVEHLHHTWRIFVTRGQWRSWRDDAAPPADAGGLLTALFYATRLTTVRSGSRYLDARQVRRIAGHVFTQKCHAET